MASRARDECRLDEVIFIPCRLSPHKSGLPQATGEQRLAMLKKASHESPWTKVSRLELDRPLPSYSWQTAEAFSQSYPKANLYWILGQDQWQNIDSWAKPDILKTLLTFIVFARKNHPGQPREGYRANFINFHHPAAASDIRQSLVSGDVSPLSLPLHPAVASYIRTHALYHARPHYE